MTKNSLLVYVAVGVLGAAFAVVSVLVFMAGPRRALIKHKFNLGTTIIFFTGLLAACNSASSDDIEPMCYDVCYSALPDGGPDASSDTDADADTDTDTDTDADDDVGAGADTTSGSARAQTER